MNILNFKIISQRILRMMLKYVKYFNIIIQFIKMFVRLINLNFYLNI